MNHTFNRTLLGLVALAGSLLIGYYFYRKALERQALASIQHKAHSPIMSLSSFIMLSTLVLVVMSVLIIYTDYTMSAQSFSGQCVTDYKGDRSDPYARCFNGYGRSIFVDESKAIAQYNLEHPNKLITKRTFASQEWNLEDDFFETLMNAYRFHNNGIPTKDKHFVIDSKLDVELLEVIKKPDALRVRVQFTNVSESTLDIDAMYPINVVVDGKIQIPKNVAQLQVSLLPQQITVITYEYDGFDFASLRIHALNYMFERRL